LGGNFALFPPLVSKIFGIRKSTEIYGIVFIAFGVGGMLSPVIIKYILPSEKDDPKAYAYLTIYLLGCLFSVAALVLLYFFSEERIYRDPNRPNTKTDTLRLERDPINVDYLLPRKETD
jgi:Na+/melibiose symporter-like transporter